MQDQQEKKVVRLIFKDEAEWKLLVVKDGKFVRIDDPAAENLLRYQGAHLYMARRLQLGVIHDGVVDPLYHTPPVLPVAAGGDVTFAFLTPVIATVDFFDMVKFFDPVRQGGRSEAALRLLNNVGAVAYLAYPIHATAMGEEAAE